jgi:hypothetical protein
MAAGEWLSSRAEGEANKHELEKERWHHQTIPEHENADMCRMLQDSGLSDALAQQVANEVAAMPLDQVRLRRDVQSFLRTHTLTASSSCCTVSSLFPSFKASGFPCKI